jgi:hypothetical protein
VLRINKWDQRTREKIAVALLTAFLLGWIGVSLVVQGLQIQHYGYGSGIVNRQHLPDQIKQKFHAPGNVTIDQLMQETNR